MVPRLKVEFLQADGDLVVNPWMIFFHPDFGASDAILKHSGYDFVIVVVANADPVVCLTS